MEKDELLNELHKLNRFEVSDGLLDYMSKTAVKLNHVLALVEQLEEPEKVVVPQFVADEFDYNKNPYWEVDEARIVAHILRCAFGDEAKPSEFLDWVRENPEDYVMAVRNGYEVKKEKLYYVLNKRDETLLVAIGEAVCLSSGYRLHDGNKDKYQLTEKQIKDYDPRYWQFAVEVAE